MREPDDLPAQTPRIRRKRRPNSNMAPPKSAAEVAANLERFRAWQRGDLPTPTPGEVLPVEGWVKTGNETNHG